MTRDRDVPFHQSGSPAGKCVCGTETWRKVYLQPWERPFRYVWGCTACGRNHPEGKSHIEPRKIVLQPCRECRQERGEWHVKDCSVGSMGPGRVRDVDSERTTYAAIPDLLVLLDEIERTEYVEGLRCRDFKEALDSVRGALT